VLGHCARFRAVAGIESNLPTARLRVVEVNFNTKSSQRCDHGFAYVGIELVDQTSDE
jgi:hypothetical protein